MTCVRERGIGWSCDPDDPRVVAALTRKCDACGTPAGRRCLMLGRPLASGAVVHQIRVPEKLLLGEAS